MIHCEVIPFKGTRHRISTTTFTLSDILHTVGPMNRSRRTLTSCYNTCLKLVEQNQLRSVVR